MPIPIIPIASAVAGQILGIGAEKRQMENQQQLMDRQQGYNLQNMYYNKENQMDIWRRTGPVGLTAELKKAGLNTALMYGMSGAGGGTTGSGAVPGVSTSGAPNNGEMPIAALGMGIQLAAQKANIELTEAQTRNVEADTAKKAGVDTKNVEADTENKILQQVIAKYAGDEAKLVFERITKPNIGVAAKTNQDELEARQAVAETTYELWQEGKLKEKTVGEAEAVLLANAKTEEETKNIKKTWELLDEQVKGAKFDNIIKDLESQLQTKTGIDKNSNGILKILGRLFIGLTHK